MNATQIMMTGALSGFVYFLLVAFAGFEHKDTVYQVILMGGVVMASFLVMRKLFP